MDAHDPTGPAAVTFRSTVELGGRTATGIQVPADAVAALGPARQPLVRVTIGSYAYRSKVAVRGGVFLLPVSAEHREVAVPPDLAEALSGEPEARAFFDGLSASRKGWFVTSIESAKTPETRARRVAAAVERLREGRSNR